METVLAEKIETMFARSTLNTRMRDFYDIWALCNVEEAIDYEILAEAIMATAKTRGHDVALADYMSVIDALAASKDMATHWKQFQDRNNFAANVSWDEALDAVRNLCDKVFSAAIDAFPMKSIDVGGLLFDMQLSSKPHYDPASVLPVNPKCGSSVLPTDMNDGEDDVYASLVH